MSSSVHQLLAGRDFATSSSSSIDAMAASMQNYVYCVQLSPQSCALVDPAWDVESILSYVSAHALGKPVGALFTHRHLDHTGGKVALGKQKVQVPGLLHFVQHKICPVYVGAEDVEAVATQTGVAVASITACKDGDVLFDGAVKVLHTPGHTPGSVCFLVKDEYLISGDTLFLGSCGRSDLPESDPELMEQSLARLARLPDAIRVLPGHNYAAPTSSTIGQEKASNVMMRHAMSSQALRPNATSAASLLASVKMPDYVSAARRALLEGKGD